jgi:hypothetical protein
LLLLFLSDYRLVAVCSLTYKDLRVLKRAFTSFGSKLLAGNEQALRDNLRARSSRYESGWCGTTPFIRCVDVCGQLCEFLRGHAVGGSLKQRAAVSSDELRVTILGDKGGAYTKFLLTIWDVNEAQSPHNAVLLAMYKGDEDRDLIRTILTPVLEQLDKIDLGSVNPPVMPSHGVSAENKPPRPGTSTRF